MSDSMPPRKAEVDGFTITSVERLPVGAATLRALTAAKRRVQEQLVELLAPAHMRRAAEEAFAIVEAGMERMVALDTRDHKLAQELCGAHEALVARKERAAGKAARAATEAVATKQG